MTDHANDTDINALLTLLANFEWERYHATAKALVAERDALKDELDREQMRLAACGVVAISNTRETAKENREVSDEYKSSSFDQVCAAVDREMALRERVAELEAQQPASDLRERLVCAALTGILSNADFKLNEEDSALCVVAYADATLAAMRKGEQNAK